MSRTIHLGALVAFMLLGCQPTLRDNQFRCTPATIEQDCPPGMACLDGLCSFGLASAIDARSPTTGDASIDAPASSEIDAFAPDASHSVDAPVRPDAFVRTDAQTRLSEGTVCASSGQCASGLVCSGTPEMSPARTSCRLACRSDTECGANGWCASGGCSRACDPIVRDCLGEESCQARGVPGSLFVCVLTASSPGGVGAACDGSFGQCANGLVCGDDRVCRQICDVAVGGCVGSGTCVAEAPAVIWRGRQLGSCR